ncbi:MAG: hypothetical protein VKJ02_19700 [Snowella sp.]|nr:hypothetical protein [Snowella sp.]
MKQKLKLSKQLKIVITIISIFVFTILAHHFDAIGSFKLTQELPSVLAQTPTPTTTPTPQSTTTSNSNSDSVFLLLNNTNMLLWIALIGVFVVLFSALSPITGSVKMWWTGDDTKPTLKDKADFLVQALPKISESITIVLVIIVVTALTVSDKIESEGTISILSSIIGFVLGKKAAESSKNNLSTSTKNVISLIPEKAEVKFGDTLEIKIYPEQKIGSYMVDIQPYNIGTVTIQNKSTLLYQAPSKNDAGGTSEVTITVMSRTPGIPSATAKIQLIDIEEE